MLANGEYPLVPRASGVEYVDAKGVPQTPIETATDVTSNMTTWKIGWYYDGCDVTDTKADHSDAEGDDDHFCDECDFANVSEHTYGDATCTASATCSECGAGLPKEGLGAGAIVAIVIGSVAVLGGGGYAIFRFANKKKKLNDSFDQYKDFFYAYAFKSIPKK